VRQRTAAAVSSVGRRHLQQETVTALWGSFSPRMEHSASHVRNIQNSTVNAGFGVATTDGLKKVSARYRIAIVTVTD